MATVNGEKISQQEFDNVDATFAEARARFNTASANMEYTRIKSPFSGSIARRYKYPGDLITTGPKGQENPIFLLVNEKQLRVAVNIPQSDLANVAVGGAVDIKVDSFPDAKFQGTVSRLDALLDEATKTQRVLIDLDNSNGKLRAGMFANVVMHFQHRDNAITIPNDLVESAGDQRFVYIYEEGKAKKASVTLGAKDGESVEVLDGIKNTDMVIHRGMIALSDGMVVQATLSNALSEDPKKNEPGKSEPGGKSEVTSKEPTKEAIKEAGK